VDRRRCLRCGSGGPLEGDHVSGKVHGRAPDPELMADLCVACHRGKGRLFRALGLEPASADPLLRLSCIAAFVGYLATGPRDEITLPRAFLSILADTLVILVRLLEGRRR
jgi:hypothetical protein